VVRASLWLIAVETACSSRLWAMRGAALGGVLGGRVGRAYWQSGAPPNFFAADDGIAPLLTK
jgi:hypothetical protein